MDFIPMCIPYIGEEEAQAVYNQIKSGWISMGKRVQEFEKMLEEYLNVKHAIAFSNGTATLHAALLSVGVKAGDEVIVPSLSYISSANAVVFCNATPVFVQEDPLTFNAEAAAIEAKITPRTKAIMTVDLKGMPVDYDAICEVAKKHGLPIVADSAESFGAKYKNDLVGNQVDIHSFSMFANKNITCGEGGFVTTDDDAIADMCRCLRNQGQSERYKHVEIGYNYRMTDLVAAFAIEQFKRIEWVMEQKQAIAARYNEGFKDEPLFETPYIPDYVGRHSWYMYCLRLDKRINRDKMAAIMKENGIASRVSFPPIPTQPIYKKLYGYKEGDFPIAEEIFRSFIDLPNFIGMTEAQFQKIIRVTKNAAQEAMVETGVFG